VGFIGKTYFSCVTDSSASPYLIQVPFDNECVHAGVDV
jgi:hypothetical protein